MCKREPEYNLLPVHSLLSQVQGEHIFSHTGNSGVFFSILKSVKSVIEDEGETTEPTKRIAKNKELVAKDGGVFVLSFPHKVQIRKFEKESEAGGLSSKGTQDILT